MPLSRTNPTTKEDIESSQSNKTNSQSAPPFMPESEFMELFWENEQIVVQDQSTRPRKRPFTIELPSNTTRIGEESEEEEDTIIPSLRQFKGTKDFLTSEPSGLDTPDGDTILWIDDSLNDPYYTDVFSNFLGEIFSSPPARSNATPRDRHTRLSEHNGIKTTKLFQLSEKQDSQDPSTKTSVTGIRRDNKKHKGLCEALLRNRLPKQGLVATAKPAKPSSDEGTMNFSQSLKPVALAKVTLQNFGMTRSFNDVPSTSSISNPMHSMVAGSISKSSAKPFEGPLSNERLEAIYRKNCALNNSKSSDRIQSSSFASVTFGTQATKIFPEAIAASSSMHSGNSVEAVFDGSHGTMHKGKRKICEEELEYQSEDFEDEPANLDKPASGCSSKAKRSHASEVHNLSERRRRDRINEKMRALQELIPNSNKADKASMLDEAIDYLKTLQMQVQMMSMGRRQFMPPMVLPAGMQHMHMNAMTQFSPMGYGMGAGNGLGYGMGVCDANVVPRPPLLPVQHMCGPQLSCPSILWPPGLHGMPWPTSLQMFRARQQLPVSMRPFSSSSGVSANSASMLEGSVATTCPITSDIMAPSSSSKDQDTMQNGSINNHSVKECSQPSVVQNLQVSNQASQDKGVEAFISTDNGS